jgi:electron transfer flavoprotein alpha subunit
MKKKYYKEILYMAQTKIQTMIRTGILIEIENNTVKETSLGVMTAAAGHEIYALVPLDDASALKDKLAEYGADHIVSMKGMQGDTTSPDLQAQMLVAAVKEYGFEALLGTAGAVGKDLFARTAAFLDEPLLSDCIKVDIEGKKVVKSHFSGKTFATLKVTGSLFLCTVRPNAIEPVAVSASGQLIEFESHAVDPGQMKILEVKKDAGGKLDLIEAPIVISGGRAMKAKENFEMLDACAAKLGGAVGASRAAVDAGFAPHTIQVGQTGKTVSPRLYIACGVSGAVQHFAGMKTSKVIVAINEDKDAPIFSKCDYGIVGDIFDVVPALTSKL